MVRRGDIVIAGDTDLRDLYICMVLLPANSFRENLRVRILEPIQYPIQHAIAHPDVASENPPLPKDGVAMLRYTAKVQGYTATEAVERSETEEVYETAYVRLRPMAEYYREIGSAGYAAALRKALDEYERQLRLKLAYQQAHPCQRWMQADPKELDILARHRRGEYTGRRSCLWN